MAAGCGGTEFATTKGAYVAQRAQQRLLIKEYFREHGYTSPSEGGEGHGWEVYGLDHPHGPFNLWNSMWIDVTKDDRECTIFLQAHDLGSDGEAHIIFDRIAIGLPDWKHTGPGPIEEPGKYQLTDIDLPVDCCKLRELEITVQDFLNHQ